MGRRRKKGRPVHGWLNLDKPRDWTSTGALNRVRRGVDAQKAGHGGALDPLATGVLPIAFGEATKLIPYVMDARKSYTFTLRWGEETDSADLEGEIIATCDHRPSREEIRAALPAFLGEIQQVPPRHSAIKVHGERAYDLVREGAAFELDARPVTAYRLDLIDADADTARFELDCGKGFYVRSLVRDLGRALGTRAVLTSLRRTRVGNFRICDAVTLDAVKDLVNKDDAVAVLQPLPAALDDIPVIAGDADAAARLRRGQEALVHPSKASHTEATVAETLGPVMVLEGSTPVAMADVVEGGAGRLRLRPIRVFNMV